MYSTGIFNRVWGRFDPTARFVVVVRVALVSTALGVIATAGASSVLSFCDQLASRVADTAAAGASSVVAFGDQLASRVTDTAAAGASSVVAFGDQLASRVTDTATAGASSVRSVFDRLGSRVTNMVADATTSISAPAPSSPGARPSLASVATTSDSVTPSAQSQLQKLASEFRSSDHFQPAATNTASASPTPVSVAALPDAAPIPNATSAPPTPVSVAALPDAAPVPSATSTPPTPVSVATLPDAGPVPSATSAPPTPVTLAALPAPALETPDKPAAAPDKISGEKKSAKKWATTAPARGGWGCGTHRADGGNNRNFGFATAAMARRDLLEECASTAHCGAIDCKQGVDTLGQARAVWPQLMSDLDFTPREQAKGCPNC
jgi:hypothetical protein